MEKDRQRKETGLVREQETGEQGTETMKGAETSDGQKGSGRGLGVKVRGRGTPKRRGAEGGRGRTETGRTGIETGAGKEIPRNKEMMTSIDRRQCLLLGVCYLLLHPCCFSWRCCLQLGAVSSIPRASCGITVLCLQLSPSRSSLYFSC